MRTPRDEPAKVGRGHPQPLQQVLEGSKPAQPDSLPRLRGGAGGGASSPERTCILSRRPGTRDSLVRLALGPEGGVAPDVRARAPGRGAWIGVDRATLEAAQAKGKLQSALARAFKTGAVTVPADLGDRIEAALRRDALDRLGLEARAGALITGAEKIEAAARRGEVTLLLSAADAGADGRGKLDQAWRVGGGPSTPPAASLGTGPARGLVLPVDRPILSMALGRENVVHVAIIDQAAAGRVSRAIDRWRAFIGPEAAFEAEPAEMPSASSAAVNEG